MTLTPAQLDRAVGALLGTAAGDALGAPYEFGPPRGPQLEVAMTGGGIDVRGFLPNNEVISPEIDCTMG
jgi:hypothetical protein